MAKPFARKFYNSKAWEKVRAYVFERDHRLCVKCGGPGQEVHHIKHITPQNINDTKITLDEFNLITLCKNCHHKEHERNQYSGQPVVEDGLRFDENGELVTV